MGSSNRLGDRVKKDERNEYQMREREKKEPSTRVFLWEAQILFQPVQFQPVLTWPANAANLDTRMGNLGTKKPVGLECMKHI